MVVVILVAGLVVVGAALVGQSYLRHTPTVASRLSGEPKWPWITALVLMSVAIAFFGVNWLFTMVLNPEAFGTPAADMQYWDYVMAAGVLGVLLLCIWIACYRPMASALLLLAMWLGIPTVVSVQMNILGAPGEFNPQEATGGPVFLAILLAPSFIVALLLVATSRSLDHPPRQIGPARADTSSETNVDAVDAATIQVLRWVSTAMLVFGVLAMFFGVFDRASFIANESKHPQTLDDVPLLLPLGLALILAILVVVSRRRPRLSAFVLFGSAVGVLPLAIAAMMATEDLAVSWPHVSYMTAVTYVLPATATGCVLLLIAWLQNRPNHVRSSPNPPLDSDQSQQSGLQTTSK